MLLGLLDLRNFNIPGSKLCADAYINSTRKDISKYMQKELITTSHIFEIPGFKSDLLCEFAVYDFPGSCLGSLYFKRLAFSDATIWVGRISTHKSHASHSL